MYQFETLHSAKTLLFLKSNSVQQCILQRLVFWRIGLTWFLRISQRKIIYIIYKYAHLNFSLQMGPIGHKMTHHGLTMRDGPKMFFLGKITKLVTPLPSLTFGPNLKSEFSCKK